MLCIHNVVSYFMNNSSPLKSSGSRLETIPMFMYPFHDTAILLVFLHYYDVIILPYLLASGGGNRCIATV